jgi:hypothetical protein
MKKQNLNLENYQITELNHFEYLPDLSVLVRQI